MLVPLGLFYFMKYKTIDDINNRKSSRSKLTAIQFCDSIKINNTTYRIILCKCECGANKKLSINCFLKKDTLSCGCSQRKYNRKGKGVKYHPCIPRLHNIYFQMIERCYNPKSISYHNYGGRGVTVCDEWKTDYQSFLDWSLKNGYSESLCLDKDIKGNGLIYSPDSCLWVTRVLNNNNKRGYKKYDYNGEKLTIAQIARLNNITRQLLYFFTKKRGNNIYVAIELCHKFNIKKYENN